MFFEIDGIRYTNAMMTPDPATRIARALAHTYVLRRAGLPAARPLRCLARPTAVRLATESLLLGTDS